MSIGVLAITVVLLGFLARQYLLVRGISEVDVGEPNSRRITHPISSARPSANDLILRTAIHHVASAQPHHTEQFMAHFQMALRNSRSEERTARIEQFIAMQSISRLRELPQCTDFASLLPPEVAQSILRRLAHADASWTREYVQTMPESQFRTELLGIMLAQWGTKDLPAALAWAQQLSDVSLRQSALLHLSYRWFESDPVDALAFAALHPAENQQLLSTLVSRWTREQPAAAVAWAAEFSHEAVMEQVTASAIASWAENDALAAADFALQLPAGNLRNEALISVISNMAQKHPNDGALLATAIPNGYTRDYAIENLAYRWTETGADSFLIWANHLSSTDRDSAIFAGAGALMDSNPLMATNWAMLIKNENRRVLQAERAAHRWMETDRRAADAWIRQSTLPVQSKARLLN